MTRHRTLSTPVNATTLASLRPGSPIFISWIDAHHVADAWLELSEIDDELCKVHSVGFYVQACSEQIVYASDWIDKGDDEVHVNSVSAIPFGCIKEITVLESD